MRYESSKLFVAFFFGLALILTPFLAREAHIAFAQSASEIKRLQDEIADRNGRLSEIEAEIAQYQAELQKVGAEKNTLQRAINQLELERKKIEADLNYTQNRIGATDLEISKLNIEIETAEEDITRNERAIEEIIRRIHETDDNSLIETLLRHENLSEFWSEVETLQHVKSVMGDEVRSLVSMKILLEEKRAANAEKRDNLVDLRDDFSNQQQVLVNNKVEKDQLLQETKSVESNYQSLLAQKQAAREQIEQERRAFESQLQFILDPSSVPTPGTVVFDWPVGNVIITQLFGGTEFAKRNASVYGGRAYHPGVDFGVPRGSKIYAPLAGTVRATGNTDLVPGCYSWGKWTLVDHANGLATLYAHQDVISVSPGQRVSTGDVIGYTGNTGYSTGPHLHFTVYAKSGVSVRKFNEIKTVTSCGPAETPVAATDAYLDPMNYLPTP